MTDSALVGPLIGFKVFHGQIVNHTKAGPGRMPKHRHRHNPPGTKLGRRVGRR